MGTTLERVKDVRGRWLEELGRGIRALIIDVMRTHPMMLIDGILYQNPFFVPPELFLQQLRSRTGEETPLAH